MTRASWIKVGIVVGAVLVVSTAAFADQVWETPGRPSVGLREIYNRNVFFGNLEGSPVQLPRPIGGMSVNAASDINAVAGPVAATPESPTVGSAIAQARGGGSMYSEKELADREIGRLIRRLD